MHFFFSHFLSYIPKHESEATPEAKQIPKPEPKIEPPEPKIEPPEPKIEPPEPKTRRQPKKEPFKPEPLEAQPVKRKFGRIVCLSIG